LALYEEPLLSAFILSALFYAYRGYKKGAPWSSTGREWTDVSGIGDADGGGRGVVVVRQMAIETIECGIWFLVSCCAFCYICNCMIFGFLAPFL
jgi:hypothetical protein